MCLYIMSTNRELSECWRSVHIIIMSCKSVVLIHAPPGPKAGSDIYFQTVNFLKRSATRLGTCDVIEQLVQIIKVLNQSGFLWRVIVSYCGLAAVSPCFLTLTAWENKPKDGNYRLKILCCPSAMVLILNLSVTALKKNKKKTPCQSNYH